MSSAPEAADLPARIAAATAQLTSLAGVAHHAHELAYGPSGQRYDLAAVRVAPHSTPPRAGDRHWAAAYTLAARAVCWADRDLHQALTAAGIRRPAMQTHHVRARHLNPTPAFLARVADNATAALQRIPGDPGRQTSRHLNHALEHITRAHQLLPDTRNPIQPRICKDPYDDGCERLLGDDRGTICARCRKKRSRSTLRRAA